LNRKPKKETDTNKQTYRIKRMVESVDRFLNGKARRPYSLREDISRGLKDAQINPCLNNAVQDIDNMSKEVTSSCVCKESIGKFEDMFNNMLHTGQSLIHRASIQEPKKPHKKYRNINKQNEWLLENVFDVYGNYLFCVSCITKILDVHSSRLRRLREIKREQANAPIRQMRKKDILKERARDIIPPENITNVLDWWVSLDNNSLVDLREPPKLHHGSSNNSKKKFLSIFLDFVDTNSQPNGRQVGSHGPLFFFCPKFDRINAPSKSEVDKPDQWKRRSLVYEFNHTLDVSESISNGTAKSWLKLYRPKHAISPQQTDYCVICAECQEQKRRAETTCNRLQQNGNGDEERMRECQTLAESYGLLLEEHRMEADRELRYYRQQANKSRSSYLRIQELQDKKLRTKEDNLLLQKIIKDTTFTLSLDFQQSKLTPHWGYTAQPGETYYLRKLSHNIFGIINHALARNAVYVSDELACAAKNGDLTISFLDHYLHQKIPSWVRHLCFYMDNGATNKNQYMVQYGMELVQHNHFETIKLCFLVAGHAKFDPDRLFSRIANAFNNNDVFVTEQLLTLIQNTIKPTGDCIHITNNEIIYWKGLLANKYKPLEDIKKYREFLIKRDDDGKVAVFQRKCCYEGDSVHKVLLKEKVAASLDIRKQLKKYSYLVKGMSPKLSDEKIQDLCKMFDNCIDPELRPEWLPVPQSVTMKSPATTGEPPSAMLARRHREELKKTKRKMT